MKEAVFNTEVVNSLKSLGAWVYKVPDLPSNSVTSFRFNPEKPADIIMIVGGKGALIEGKQLKKFEAFGLRHLRDSQVKEMDKAVDRGARAFVFLNIRIRASREKRTKHVNRLMIFDWATWRDRFKSGVTLKKSEIESLKFIEGQSVLVGEGVLLKRVMRFDLRSFCEAVVRGEPYACE